MTIILFLVDTSSSMNQRTYLGARPTLLDVAKDAVEKFLKARARDISSRGDKYLLLTFEDPPNNIKSGWAESNAHVFLNELKLLTATGLSNMGPALKNAFDLLNLKRMETGIDMYGLGRAPYYLDPSVIIVITDGSSLTHQGGVQQTLELPMQTHAIPGTELTREPFRWDQRLFSLVLRSTGCPPVETSSNAGIPHDQSPIEAMCAVTAGRSYSITTQRSIIQAIDALVQKVQSGVVIQFEKVGPDPAPIDNEANSNDSSESTTNNTNTPPAWHSTRSLIYVPRSLQKGYPIGHWPIPEAYWPDLNLAALPPRTAHPIVKFTCATTEPHMMDALPFDKYELESSPLTQYILSRKQPHVAWQVFVSNSGKQPGELGAPFGYLKAATSLNCVNLFVLPYNYPVLLPIMDEILKKPQHPGKPPREWKPAFDEYLRNMPPYYATPLKRALTRMQAVSSLVPDNLESSCFSYAVHTKLKNYKSEAKAFLARLNQTAHQPKSQNIDTVRVLQCGNNLRSQVESTSYCNMGCTGRPAPAFYYRYSSLKSELNEFPNYIIRVKASAFTSNENLRTKHTFRNPYDIDRKDLIDQIHLMRANFMQSPSRIKFKDEDQIHTLPVAQMGNYQDYLKKQPTPLREIESTPVRQHMFGNPFKIDKKGMMVDEADSLGLTDVGSQSPKNKKPNPPNNQRRRGPLPKDFILNQSTWQRTPSTSPTASPSPSPVSSPLPTPSGPQGNGKESQVPIDKVVTGPEHNGNSLPSSSSTLSSENNSPTGSNNTSSSCNNNLVCSPTSVCPTEQDLALRSDIFKHIRGPGVNYASVLKTISKLHGEKRKFILEETIREAKRFKKVRLLHQLNLISRQ